MRILSDTLRTARKQHTCDAYPSRGHSIEPGEVYHEQTAIGDDGPYRFRSCAYHAAIMEAMWRDGHYYADEGINGNDVTEQLYEWWGEAERHAERGEPYPVPFDPAPKRWREMA